MTMHRTDQVYELLVEYAAAGKPCPTNQEIADFIGWKSRASVVQAVEELEVCGWISVERVRWAGARVVTITETGATTAETRPPHAIPIPGTYAPKGRQCQWIEGDPTPDDSCKCRKPVVEGRPYCEEHCARSYRKPDEAA